MAQRKHAATIEQSDHLKQHMEQGRSDFPYFCRWMLGITLHEGQLKAWLKIKEDGYKPAHLFLCGNRAGKTIFLACYHIWKNFYKIYGPGKEIHPDYWKDTEYDTANVAPHTEQTIIIFNLILRICRGQFSIREPDGQIVSNMSIIRWFVDEEWLNNPQKAPKNGPYEIHFANGASFKAYTMGGSHADIVQGRAFGLISYDEFGRSKAPKQEFEDLLPRVADFNGEIFLITTPDENNPDASEFLLWLIDKAEEKNSLFSVIHWSTTDNHFMGAQSIEVMTAGMSEEKKRQIIHGTLIRASVRYFPYRKVETMFDQGRVDYKMIDFINRFPESHHKYFGGLDTAGMGKDWWAFYVIDYTEKPFKVVFSYASNKATPTENREITRGIIQNFLDYCGSNFRWHMDFTSEGGTIVFDDLKDLDPIPFRFGIEKGSGKNMKIELMENMRRALHEEMIVCPTDLSLQNQFVMYRGPQDDKKNHTDRLMAVSMAVYEPYKRLLTPAVEESWISTFGD